MKCKEGTIVVWFLSVIAGFVLKKDQKKENKEDEISLEDLIEKEVRIVFIYLNNVSK